MAAAGTSGTDLRSQFLYASISDIQGSIRANDTKASAVLVLQGVLFSGTLALTASAGSLLSHASQMARDSLAITAGFALAFFLASVLCLLWAIVPYQPNKKLVSRMKAAKLKTPRGKAPRVFFPDLQELRAADSGGGNELVGLLDSLRGLDPTQVETELAYEVVMVADIRRFEASFTTYGFFCLLLQLGFLVAYLAIVAGEALGH